MIINPIKTILKMKKSILLLILIATMIVVNHSAYATLKRLNNNLGVVADYTNIDDALNGQSTWDTLYVEPSATNYDIITNTCPGGFGISAFVQGFLNAPNKVILGNGYFLDNSNIGYVSPELQDNSFSSKIGANVSGQSLQSIRIGNNTTCIGLNFQTTIRQQNLQSPYKLENINLTSCLFIEEVIFITTQNIANTNTTVSNIQLRKCFLTGGVRFQLQDILNYFNVNNFVCENNIILGVTQSIGIYSALTTDVVIRNNVCTKGYYCKGAYCANNIFLNTDTTQYFFQDNNVKNNIFSAPAFSPINVANFVNNQFNISSSLLFEPLNVVGGPDADFYLVSGSPAIGAGVPNGSMPVDCGAFGGPDPYKLSGIPPFPTIYSLTTPPVIPAGTNMNLTISTRSNQ